MSDWLVSMKSLSVAYNGKIVLSDINFTIRKNDFIGVIGPNGGGKTTLLKTILDIVHPFRGSIEFNEGIDGSKLIGYLPQMSTGDFNYPLTVKDVILSGLMIRKKLVSRMSNSDRQKAEKVMNELGLSGLSSALLKDLSGGQQQRVFLGRAVIGDPGLLLLDEPGTFVDANFENDFYEKLRDLNRKMAILMVSHDIGTISAYIKSFACVNRTLHYHPSSEITNEDLLSYGFPIQLVTHGVVPHTVLKIH